MRRKALFALTAATVIATSGSVLSAQAAVRKSDCEKLQNENCIVIGGTVNKQCDLKDVLSQIEEEMKNCKWKYCFPNIIIPGTGLPENDKPAVNCPETEIPEVNEPETEVPEIEVPDSENTKPEITKIPEQDNSATEKPGDTTEATFAEQVVKLVNEERAKAGLNELTIDKNIESAAIVRAKEITQSFSHTRPNGSNFSTVLKEQGISYRGAGENIAWGQTTPEEVMKAWMNSEGHRANILNSKFTKIGVGHYENAKGTDYWAQLFTY